MDENTQQEVKIGKLEVRMGNMEIKVDKIMENHLPHLQDKLDKVHDKQTYWGGALAILTIIVPFLINYIFK